MQPVKMVALEPEDLPVISAHVQDAVLKVGDISYFPGEQRLVLGMNRFCWETALQRCGARQQERRRTALHIARVLSCRSQGIDRSRPEQVLSLLAITFEPGEMPGGSLLLTFCGRAAIRLEVECIEVQLADLGAAWATHTRPKHLVAAV